MKGIILAGGTGSRMFPLTKVVSKQMLPIYDKPMIYYPLSTLLLLNIREICIISTPQHIKMYKTLFGNGNQFGITIEYIKQKHPKGIAEAFILAEEFIQNDEVCLILGDNIFYGQNYIELIKSKLVDLNGALILGYPVNDPSQFGVVEFDKYNKVISLEEKPRSPKSKYAIPGLYFYDKTVVEKSKLVKPSIRGELEITDLNNLFLSEGRLSVHLIGRGVAWLDTGSADSLKSASDFVGLIQKRQGLYIACIEEIAWRKGFIDLDQLKTIGMRLQSSDYGKYILSIASNYEENML
jgi:glucose-1-phosphate thymidylyltransferase